MLLLGNKKWQLRKQHGHGTKDFTYFSPCKKKDQVPLSISNVDIFHKQKQFQLLQ
jgi:hypothetical protein